MKYKIISVALICYSGTAEPY